MKVTPAFFTTAVFALLAVGCATGISGSGNVTTQSRAVEGFSAVQVNGSSEVRVSISSDTTVKVTTDDNLQEFVETEVSGDTLVIRTRGWFSTSSGVQVDITVPSLRSAKLSGSGDIIVEGLAEDNFAVGITGSGDITVGGSAKSVEASISGSGDLMLRQLEAQRVELRISGSGDASVNATEALVAQISGSGDIKYVDHPGLDANARVSGSGNVSTMKLDN